MDKPQRKTWRVIGVKRTRTHSIKLLADTAEEAISIASNPPYKLKVSGCVEELPIRSDRPVRRLGREQSDLRQRWLLFIGKL